eukprot:gene35252-47380_t
MKYYPLIQVFIRRYVIQADDTANGATWNEFNNYQYQTFASQLMNSICSPSSGACYFFLFLYMQPRAYTVFCRILRSWFCCTEEDIPTADHEQRLLIANDYCHLDEEDLNELDEDVLEQIINLNGNYHLPDRSMGSLFFASSSSSSFASFNSNGTAGIVIDQQRI